MSEDYYSVLGITPGASQAAVHDAFFRIASKYHAEADPTAEGFARLNEINEAWQVLSDPIQRAQYDASKHWQSRTRSNLSRDARASLRRSEIRIPERIAFTVAVLVGKRWRFDVESERATIVLAALEVGALLTACLNFLGERQPLIWVIGIILASGLAFFNFVHSPRSSRSIIYSLAGILVAGVVISAIDLLFFARISSAIVTQVQDRAPIAVSAHDSLLPVFPAVVEAAGCTQPCAAPSATPSVSDQIAGCEQSCEQPTPTTAGAVPTATRAPAAPALNSSQSAPVRPTATRALPTATLTPADFKYPPPVLISPANGASYFCHRELTLQWRLDAASPAGLGSNEWFLAESKQMDHPDWFGISDWTQDTSLVLHPTKGANGCDIFWWPNLGVFQWRIRIVSGDRDQHAIKQFLSGEGQAFTITYGR